MYNDNNKNKPNKKYDIVLACEREVRRRSVCRSINWTECSWITIKNTNNNSKNCLSHTDTSATQPDTEAKSNETKISANENRHEECAENKSLWKLKIPSRQIVNEIVQMKATIAINNLPRNNPKQHKTFHKCKRNNKIAPAKKNSYGARLAQDIQWQQKPGARSRDREKITQKHGNKKKFV